MYSRWQLWAVIGLLFLAPSVSAQCPVMPPGFLCISQAAGNAAAENARELAATKNKVTVLEASLVEKDKSIEEVKATAAKNVADLTAENTKILLNTAEKTGQLIKCEAFAVRDGAIIEFLVKNQRSKQSGLINIKLGGN